MHVQHLAAGQYRTLATIVESSPDAVIGLAADGTVTSWNAAATATYGYTADEMIGHSFKRIVPPELHGAELRLLEKALHGNRLSNAETSRVARDGKRRLVSRTLFAIADASDGVTGLASIERDVTAQRALEAQLLQAKRMEAVGRLGGGVAQEFNNINTTIIGLVEFIAQELAADSPARADLEEINKQALRGSRLARHLLAFSGRQILTSRVVSVDELLRTLEPLLQRLASERIWLTLDLTDDGTMVGVDESQLELVIFELVLNACDAVGDRGAITLATRTRDIDAAELPSPYGVPTGRYVELTVRDSGPGMSPGTQALAFDPFFTTREDGTRLGLGLAMVYGVVQQLGGHVWLGSAPQGGAEVTVLLPAVLPAETASAEPRRTSGGSETVLVVEDEGPVRDVICRGLRGQGYTVLEAKNGEDALLVAEKFNAPIHLVVSDVVMPQMDGRTLFSHLRNWYPTIRFLFISGYTRGALAGTEMQESPTRFLAKPFSVERLCSEVRELLDQPRGRAPGAG